MPTPDTPTATGPRLATPFVVGAAAGYSALAVVPAPMTLPVMVTTTIPCLGLVAAAASRGWHRRRPLVTAATLDGPSLAAVAIWVVLIGATVVIQLLHFFSEPRDVYPTLSSLAALVFDAHFIRASAFALWLWLGWYLVSR